MSISASHLPTGNPVRQRSSGNEAHGSRAPDVENGTVRSSAILLQGVAARRWRVHLMPTYDFRAVLKEVAKLLADIPCRVRQVFCRVVRCLS